MPTLAPSSQLVLGLPRALDVRYVAQLYHGYAVHVPRDADALADAIADALSDDAVADAVALAVTNDALANDALADALADAVADDALADDADADATAVDGGAVDDAAPSEPGWRRWRKSARALAAGSDRARRSRRARPDGSLRCCCRRRPLLGLC